MEIDIKKEKPFRGKHSCFGCYIICMLAFITPFVILILSTSHYLYTYIVMSIILSIFTVIGVLIFFYERKLYLSDLSKIKTEYKPEGVVITDVLKTQSFQITLILILFIIIMILSALGAAMGLEPIPAIIAVVIIVVGLVVGMVFILFKIEGMEKIRKFSISDKSIEISIPPRPIFHINWIDFDTIKIEYKRKTIYGPAPGSPPLIISYHKLNFLGENFAQKFKIESGKDFRVEKTKEVFDLLEVFAFKMNKEFVRPGEEHLL